MNAVKTLSYEADGGTKGKKRCWVLCVGMAGEGRLKGCMFLNTEIKTGRARFRATGKLMQGNGLRHQPAHCRLC